MDGYCFGPLTETKKRMKAKFQISNALLPYQHGNCLVSLPLRHTSFSCSHVAKSNKPRSSRKT